MSFGEDPAWKEAKRRIMAYDKVQDYRQALRQRAEHEPEAQINIKEILLNLDVICDTGLPEVF